MSRYLVPIYTTVSRCIEIEADSEEDAINLAWNSEDWPGGLCHQCAHEVGALGDWDIDEEGVELV